MLKSMINPVLSGKTRIILLFTLLFMVNIALLAQAPDWQWAVQAGGSDVDFAKAITIDNAENIYVTGYFNGTATFGSYSLTSSGFGDIFAAKMDASGNWQWATQAGSDSPQLEGSYGITIDDSGNSYVTGKFQDTATFGSYSITSIGYGDIFVAKIDANGNWLWATQAGGNEGDNGYGITIDNLGNCYVTGYYEVAATFGSFSVTSYGGVDIFVAKIDTDGNWLWVSQTDETCYSNNIGYAINIDDAGNSYVTGRFEETVTFGSYSLISSGTTDIFVAKIDADGNWLWATQAGSDGDICEAGLGITIDDAGNSYVTGYFYGTASFGSYSLTSYGGSDIFVAKIDANGNWLWATQAGGDGEISEAGHGITIDDTGNIYVTGGFGGTATFGSYSLTSSGLGDLFVAKMDTNGNWLWATQADSGGGIDIIRDNAGNIYVTGGFGGTATFGPYYLTSSGAFDIDIFVAKLNNSVFAENEISPTEIELSNYPNPFNPATKIHYSIKEKSNVRIDVCNIKGQLVKSLINGQQDAGEHSVIWNGKDDNANNVSSGIYFYKLNVNGEEKAVRKCVLLK